ncbi:MAG: MerR family transcriptional regulator, partial [Lutibacter sp.]|nr:MerR family transcriptional regulator [Lutibacter sp.]
WENEFDILKPKKNKKGNRLFTQEDIKNLKLIYHLVKEKGFTLEGAKNKMKERPKAVKNNQEIITRLEAIKEELIKIKGQIG